MMAFFEKSGGAWKHASGESMELRDTYVDRDR